MAVGRGEHVVIALVVAAFLVAASLGHALLVNDSPMAGLWLTPDQQGRRLFAKGDYAAAADRFEDPMWKGIAYYKSRDFTTAAAQFARLDTPDGFFNQGDAYARAGHLDQAVAAFEEALRRRPDDKAARENRDLVHSLIQRKQADEDKDRPLKGQPPTFDPDEIKVDDKGKQGQRGKVEQAATTADQIESLWLRRLQTTPSDFLRLKFAAQVETPAPSGPRGGARRGE